jgi:ATP-dependent helicase HrpB
MAALADRFAAALARRRVVVTAPTGSGKSTLVPRWLLAAGARVLVVEPRRVACRSLARHVAAREGSALGGRVGYAVRHDDRSGPQTRLLYATTGVVLRRFQEGDGGFGPFDAVVLDEVHERSVEVDLLLALLRRAATAPGGPLAVVMSATVAAERLATWLDAARLEGEGRLYPVDVAYRGDNVLPETRELAERVRDAVRAVLERPGDVLVFLPGKGEIAAAARALRDLPGLEVIPLHGALPPEAQDRAFEPEGPRRVVLATNVAETAITLPRIGVVVDAGLVRQTRYRDGHGVLTTVPIALDAAEQRRGRAGRLMPGVCLRLWHPGARLLPTTPPELLREGLEPALLAAAACGLPLADLPLLDPPPPHALSSAAARLRALDALDAAGALTDTGRALARLPLDPLHARLVVEAQRRGRALLDAVDLVAALEGGRRVVRPPRDADVAEAQRALRDGMACDASLLVAALRRGVPGRDGLDGPSLEEARRVAAQLREQLGLPAPAAAAPIDREGLARAIVAALPDSAFVPRKRGEAWTCGGAEVRRARESLADPQAPALVVVATHRVEAGRGRGIETLATVAVPTTLAVLREEGAGTWAAAESEVRDGVLVTTLAQRLAHVTLAERQEAPQGAVAVAEAARLFAEGRLGRAFRPAAEEARERLAAWALLRRLRPGNPTPGDGSSRAPAGFPDEPDAEGPGDLQGWARGRLAALGFVSGRDLPLLGPDDLRVPDLPPADRAWLDQQFPRALDLGDARCRVEYDLPRRTVTVVLVEGRRAPPPPAYLPAWRGWRVRWQDRAVVRLIREG